jgi:hypothetical protein
MQSGIGPRTCPGLTVNKDGVIWRDSLGHEFDLAKEKRISPGEAATKMKRSTEWVLRKIRANELYPHVYYNPRLVEVWACALDDYLVRNIQRANPGRAGDVAA